MNRSLIQATQPTTLCLSSPSLQELGNFPGMTQPARSGLEFQPRSPALPKPALALGLQSPYHGETNPSHQPGKKALGVFRELVCKFGEMQGWKTAAELKSSDIIVCCRVIYLLQLNLVIFQLFQLSKNRLHLDGPGCGGGGRRETLLY